MKIKRKSTFGTVTSKGQITIPISVRKHLELAPGDRVEFVFNDDTSTYEMMPANRSVMALKGIIRKPEKPVSIEEMNKAIAKQGALE